MAERTKNAGPTMPGRRIFPVTLRCDPDLIGGSLEG
jgi:hypothetical protein